MITLSIQLKLILFSLIYGFLFSYVLDSFNIIIKKMKTYLQIILSFIFIFISVIIYFIGIQKIGNAIFHIYSLVSIVIGFIFYEIIKRIIENNSNR